MTHNSHLTHQARQLLRYDTGIVIPVYFPEHLDSRQGEALLRDTVAGYCEQVAEPARICLSVDGGSVGTDVAERLVKTFRVSSVVSPQNVGKLHAARNGVQFLLATAAPQYLAVIDQDGDHFAHELLNFLWTADHIAHHQQTDRIIILGRRITRHRSMGFLRGELEELCDRMLLDALQYRAVVAQRPLALDSAFLFDEFPDFHSGYKLFSAPTAKAVFLEPPQQAGVSERCYFQHACEAVMAVEALEYGACLGVVNRTTFNEQPISTFGKFNQVQLAADMILWPCKRLEIPISFVEQWFANHLPRLLLHTVVPDGRETLEQIRQTVLATLREAPDYLPAPLFLPLFL